MMTRSMNLSSAFLLVCVVFSSLFDTVKADRDLPSFTTQGFVSIATIGGTFVFLYTLYYSAAKTGYGGWRNHALWFLLNIWLYMSGIFLIFGPDSLINVGIDGYGTGTGLGITGPRSAIIGLQLVFQSALGVFAIYSANAYASLVFGLLGIFNALCLMGSNFLFNYNEPIWLLSQPECNAYFRALNIQRCNETGYLEFLRIIGTIAIIAEGYLVTISLLAYATAVPAYGHPGAAGAPVAGPYGTAATGYPAGTYGTATAGPGFVTQGTAVPAAAGPTTTYATTTQQPYATTTTTHTTQVQ